MEVLGDWTYLEIDDKVMSSYSTPVMVPVSPEMDLIRMPFTDLVTVEEVKLTPLTVLSVRPPTEPIQCQERSQYQVRRFTY